MRIDLCNDLGCEAACLSQCGTRQLQKSQRWAEASVRAASLTAGAAAAAALEHQRREDRLVALPEWDEGSIHAPSSTAAAAVQHGQHHRKLNALPCRSHASRRSAWGAGFFRVPTPTRGDCVSSLWVLLLVLVQLSAQHRILGQARMTMATISGL
eukprot:366468-Chlamydomonas_euryale.AAC.7